MTLAKPLPSQKELNAMFDYYPETGKLVWKYREDRDSQWNGRRKGKEAGSVHHAGYRRVHFDGGAYFSHRLIWAMAYGSIPEHMQVDHVNGNKLDNRLCNLRLVTNGQNQLNRGADRGRKFKGVYKKGSGFKAEITHQGERIYIGYYKSETKAATEYDKKALELHGEHAKLNFPKLRSVA